MDYCCPRCGYDTNILGNFKKHINKKFICEPIKSNVSLDSVRAIHNKKKDTSFVCTKCSKGFASRSGYLTHFKKCEHVAKEEFVPIQTVTNMFNSIINVLNKIVTTQNILIVSVENLQSKNSLQIDESKNSLQNVEDPFEFGQYTTDHIYSDKYFMKKVMEEHEKGLITLIKSVWCNPKYPKNMSFRISNSKVEVYTNQQKWHSMYKTSFIEDLMCYCGQITEEFVNDNKSMFSKSFLDSYMIKIGLSLEWDISHDSYKCSSVMEEQEIEKEKERIYEYVSKELGIK